MIEKNKALKRWVRRVPASTIEFPKRGIEQQVKFVAWRLITPLHNPVRNFLIASGLLSHAGRQQYLLGHLAPHSNLESLVEHLLTQGWGNHFIAWEDDGQVISLRKTIDFSRQYHLRIFEDGEVRGHFEYTPEFHVAWHMRQVGMEERRDEFLELLRGHITPAQAAERDFAWSFAPFSRRSSV